MSQCKNEILNSNASAYPKSCPLCKFGPCKKGVKPASESKYPISMYVGGKSMYKYAVFYETQTWHEGDERSRTNPGHGYPAGYSTSNEYRKFDSEQQLKDWILAQNQYKKFTAIRYEELRVNTSIEVSLS